MAPLPDSDFFRADFRKAIGMDPPWTRAEVVAMGGLRGLCRIGCCDMWHLTRKFVVIQRAYRAHLARKRARAAERARVAMLCLRRLGAPAPAVLRVARLVRSTLH